MKRRGFHIVHPSENIRGTLSDKLAGKIVLLGVTGGIAAVECVKLARLFIRHGAAVVPVMTPEACRFVTPLALEFATGVPPVTELTGATEHVSLSGDVLVIAPCTANTLAKIAAGVADTAVCAFALSSTAPVVLCPSMHRTMYDTPVVAENLDRCQKRGMVVVSPVAAESKAKMASSKTIVSATVRAIRSHGPSRSVLVVGGATHEPVDDVRVLTNLSSGKMVRALAVEAFERGHDVTVWTSCADMPPFVTSVSFRSVEDLRDLVERAGRFDVVINCAAVSDFVVERRAGKMAGDAATMLTLRPAPRINPLLRDIGTTAVGFKLAATSGQVVGQAREVLERDCLDYVVGNTIDALGADRLRAWCVGKQGLLWDVSGTKDAVAKKLFDTL
jgi:phosphopantothenoylcysteine decarboxylase/phosphopantothenate--cysteine ligase